MKILIIVGPAPGILNHAIALSNLLHTQGNHEVLWLTGEKSRNHLEMVGFNFSCEYSSYYDINFNRQDLNRKPHLQQVCDLAYLNEGIEYELSFFNKKNPDLIITKHHYSPTISARVACIPYVTYYTDAMNEARSKSMAEFKKRDDAWLLSGETPKWDWNNYCKWFHVVEHFANHRGQITWYSKRLPGKNS